MAAWLPVLSKKFGRLAALEENFEATLLTEKLEAMAEFAAGAGHEINNPLTVIAGRAQLFLREEKDPERRPESANAFSRELDWCRSHGEWNRDKARYWWRDNESRLENLFGLSSKAKLAPAGGGETIEIRLDGR